MPFSLFSILSAFVGMCGIRPDRWRQPYFYRWLTLWILFNLVYIAVFSKEFSLFSLNIEQQQRIAVLYAILGGLIYYVGNSILLGTVFRSRMIQAWGPSPIQAYPKYEWVLGLVFLNQGLSQSAVFSSFSNTLSLPVPTFLLMGFAWFLILFGAITKLWATLLIGVDKFYYKDMFLDAACYGEHKGSLNSQSSFSAFVTRGPYRFFKNPMYGVGNLQGYGVALLHQSLEGLICAGIFQTCIFIFYFLFEKPFIKRAYSNDFKIPKGNSLSLQ